MRSMPFSVSFVLALVVATTCCRSTAPQNNSQTGNQNAVAQNAESPPTANSNAAAPENPKQENASTGGRYRIDPQSRVTARVFVGGLFAALGHDHTISIPDVTGDVELTPGTVEPASLRITIKASSAAEVGKEFGEKERQEIDKSVREEALETAKYPVIVFKSTKISATRTGEGQYQAKIAGDLTLHGATHAILIPARVTLKGNNLRAQGEFAVRHSDYQIKRLSAGGGTIKAKDEMKLSFDIVSHKY